MAYEFYKVHQFLTFGLTYPNPSPSKEQVSLSCLYLCNLSQRQDILSKKTKCEQVNQDATVICHRLTPLKWLRLSNAGVVHPGIVLILASFNYQVHSSSLPPIFAGHRSWCYLGFGGATFWISRQANKQMLRWSLVTTKHQERFKNEQPRKIRHCTLLHAHHPSSGWG